jgi:hypothetical protein
MERKPTIDSSRKNSKELNAFPTRRFIIEIASPSKKLNLSDLEILLKDTGISLDQNYGPFLVNPKLGHYIVSGNGDTIAKEKAEKIPGVQTFSNMNIEPI